MSNDLAGSLHFGKKTDSPRDQLVGLRLDVQVLGTALRFLEKIETAPSNVALSFAHGRADGFAEGLAMGRDLVDRQFAVLQELFQDAHNERLAQLKESGRA